MGKKEREERGGRKDAKEDREEDLVNELFFTSREVRERGRWWRLFLKEEPKNKER